MVSKAKLFEQAGVRLVKSKAKGQEADDVLLNRLHGYYWAGWDEPDFVPRLFICRGCKETLMGIPRLMYQDRKGVAFDENSLVEKLVDRKNDWWDAWKYDEVSNNTVRAGYKQRDKPLSFEWFLKLAKREMSKDKWARS